MEIIPGPDFPTGGIVLGRAGICSAYSTGRGSIVMRGKVQHRASAATIAKRSSSPKFPTR